MVRSVEPDSFTKISVLGVEAQRVLVICDIVSPPEWSCFGEGYCVEASFILWEDIDVLQVPTGALCDSSIEDGVKVKLRQ